MFIHIKYTLKCDFNQNNIKIQFQSNKKFIKIQFQPNKVQGQHLL